MAALLSACGGSMLFTLVAVLPLLTLHVKVGKIVSFIVIADVANFRTLYLGMSSSEDEAQPLSDCAR
jgi:hypothetical protein